MGVYVLDSEDRFIYASPAFERITGLGTDAVLGSHYSAIISPEDRGRAERCSGDGHDRPVRCEVAVMKNDGPEPGYRTVRYRGGHSGAAHTVGIIGRNNAALAEAEEKIRMFTIAVEQSPSTVVITDRKGTIEYVNPKFTSLTGYTLAEARGQNPRILKSGEQPDEFYRDMWVEISSGRDWRGEFHNIKKNGESYWESASISPIMNAKGEITHYIAIKEDITERKKAEEALRISEETLRSKNSQMERDLLHAQAVVGSLLPSAPPKNDRLKIDFRYVPMEAIGGDFFSFNTLHDRGFGVFIGDVVGHGVSAALFLSLVRSFTERLNFTRGDSPSHYIKDLNGDLAGWRVILFLTALYGYFDFSGEGTVFRFAKGGHTPPVLHERSTGSVRILSSGGMPVGLSPDAVFQQVEVAMKPGDRIFLYTDGIIEARDGKQTMVGPEGLESIIGRSGGLDLGGSLDYILDEVSRFSEGIRIEDDMVIIGLEVLG
ncbi:MAG: SpoIIE family protein phosphatase [Spirochaetes bacterium]|nr:SpoIIE family protein phosphatase [Spirochaetota bacterium]